MRKKACVALVLISLMLFAVLIPLAAATTDKKVPVVVTFATKSWVLGTDVWMGGDNTWHSRDSVVETDPYTITSVSEGLYLTGHSRGVVDQNLEIQGMLNGMTPIGRGNSRIDSTIYVTDNEGHSGTFEGVVHYSGEMLVYIRAPLVGFLAPYNAVAHGEWHGTGDFQGWTYYYDQEYVNAVSQGIVAFVMRP